MSTAELAAQSDVPAPPPPGEQLAAARERCGLSVAEIAQQLKLSPWQIEALESGDYRRLPSAVFVRGFIRNYARLVKLDAARLLATSEHELPVAAPQADPVPARSAEIPFPTKRGINWGRYAIVVIIVLIPLVVYEFYPDLAPEGFINSGQVELPPPQVVAQTPAAPVATAVIAPVATPAVENEPPERARQTAAPSAPEPVAEARHAPGEQVVRMRFARESWVEIRDRNGRKIFSQLNPPGTEQVVSGLPPLSLIVGNANGVQLTHNEQPVNLGPHIKVDVARLTLE